jgi:hypothetical protein
MQSTFFFYGFFYIFNFINKEKEFNIKYFVLIGCVKGKKRERELEASRQLWLVELNLVNINT